ncbi:MAG: lamin tail domain-containing protein, partial [Chloroflexota bacterium]
MTKRTSWLITFIFILWLASACNQTPVDTTPPVPPITPTSEATEDVPPTPTLKPTQVPTATAVADPNPKTVLISHVLAGVEGNNNFDYIALYNNAGEPIDLRGYTLEYLPRPDADVETVYKWRTFTPFVSDFYVLTRDDEDFAAASDVVFEQQIFNRGSLALIDPDGNLVDLVGWGDVPEESYIGSPAPKLPRGSTLVRRLAPPFTTGSNADLFMVEAEAQLPGCFPENEALSISLPETVPPGNQFEVLITKSADSDINEIQFLIPAGFALAQGEPVSEATYIGVQTSDQQTVINLKAPTTLQQAILRGSTVVIDGAETCLPAQVVSVEGRLPIAVARNLLDETVTIEGTATMFTDGFFAGSSGTKFYIEDESGGVQVYVPGGKGGVNIQLGDMVRVTGKTEYYRTSLEVIPADFAVNIEVIGQADAQTAATLIDLDSAANDIGLNGRLISVNGTVESVEEFNFSYEIDLVDPDGNKLLVYIDKLTNMSVVDVEEGADYTITGISESWDGNIRLNPRVQADLARIWPEEILVEVRAPASVSVGPVEYEIEITNYTSEPQTNILVTAPRPEGNIESIIVQTGETGVTATREIINWAIPKMEPGQSVTLRMSVSLSDSGQSDDGGADDRVFFFPVRASSDQTVEPVFSEDLAVFTSGILPIWAIQGSGDKSPYIGR